MVTKECINAECQNTFDCTNNRKYCDDHLGKDKPSSQNVNKYSECVKLECIDSFIIKIENHVSSLLAEFHLEGDKKDMMLDFNSNLYLFIQNFKENSCSKKSTDEYANPAEYESSQLNANERNPDHNTLCQTSDDVTENVETANTHNSASLSNVSCFQNFYSSVEQINDENTKFCLKNIANMCETVINSNRTINNNNQRSNTSNNNNHRWNRTINDNNNNQRWNRTSNDNNNQRWYRTSNNNNNNDQRWNGTRNNNYNQRWNQSTNMHYGNKSGNQNSYDKNYKWPQNHFRNYANEYSNEYVRNKPYYNQNYYHDFSSERYAQKPSQYFPYAYDQRHHALYEPPFEQYTAQGPGSPSFCRWE